MNYALDPLNRQSVTDNGSVTSYVPNPMNQYCSVGEQTLQYDNRFNLKTYNGATFDYDAQNRLLSASGSGGSMQCLYDGLGRCVRRTVNGVTTFIAYDGWKPVVERDGAGNLTAMNVYGAGPDEILWRSNGAVASAADFRFHHDGRGNVTALLDGGGNLVEKYSYDAFGKPKITDWNDNVRTQSAYGNRFMFTGREWIAELGIYDYRNRMYHPDIGRFLQTDPIGLQTEGAKLSAGQKALFSLGGVAPDAFTTSELNLYRYCGDDPVDRSDPSGLIFQFPNDPKLRSVLEAQLKQIAETDSRLRSMVKELADSKNVIQLRLPDKKGDNNKTRFNEKDATNGKGTGSAIKYDPDNKNVYRKSPIGSFVHELRHAQEANEGVISRALSRTGVETAEEHAVQRANILFEHLQVPLRTTYNGVPVSDPTPQ